LNYSPVVIVSTFLCVPSGEEKRWITLRGMIFFKNSGTDW